MALRFDRLHEYVHGGEPAEYESNFDKVKESIEKKEGYSPQEAAATAAKIGREKLGQAEMTKRSVEGREKHEGK